MSSLLRDATYSLRLLRRRPGFTAVAVLALALGIGANTTVFSIVDAVLLRPLPFEEPEELVSVSTRLFDEREQNWRDLNTSIPDFLDWKESNRAFEEMAAFGGHFEVPLGNEGEIESVVVVPATASLFSLLRVQAALGRTLSPVHEEPGRGHVVCLSDGLWRRRYGADPGIVGREIRLDGRPFTVIGVLPPRFRIPDRLGRRDNVDIWAVLVPDVSFPTPFGHSNRAFTTPNLGSLRQVIARLKPGVTVQEAQAEMALVAQRIARVHRNNPRPWSAGVQLLQQLGTDRVRPALWLFMGAVGLVLLIACGNVSGLLLARSVDRQQEVSVRLSLGASRGRLVGQMMVESLMLATLGGLVGVLLTVGMLQVLPSVIPLDLPRVDAISLNLPVLGFTCLVVVLASCLFGLAPALGVSRTEPARVMNQSSKTTTIGHGTRHTSETLVVCELALALTLMLGAGLLLKSFWRVVNVDLGFENRNLLTLNVPLPADRYYEEYQRAKFHERVITRMQALPGVQRVGTTTRPPLGGMTVEFGFRREEDAVLPTDQEPSAQFAAVGPGYFETAGIPLVQGRFFNDRDDARSVPIVIISQQMAQRYWPTESPLGKRIIVFSKYSFAAREIVGLVGDVRYGGFVGDVLPHMYVPYAQEPWPVFSILLATHGAPQAVAEAARSAVAAIDARQPVKDIATIESLLARSTVTPRFHLLMVLGFAAAALFLAATGTYGMMAYSVSRRTSEIGLRKALGAESRDLVKAIMGRGTVVIATGTVLGLVGALGVSSLLSNWLFEVESTDPITFAFVPAVLALVAGLACYIPARRAARIDPMVALRAE